MGQKVNPNGFRLLYNKKWESLWYANPKRYRVCVGDDALIRDYIQKTFTAAAISKIIIERAGEKIRVNLVSPRPGALYGRKGQEVSKLKTGIESILGREIIFDVQEVTKPDLDAACVAFALAKQLERRVSVRKAVKKSISMAMSAGAKGVRIQCSGRLGGVEIAKTEDQRSGSVPLHTIREDVDYALCEARTVYGTIGVKCWICRKSS